MVPTIPFDMLGWVAAALTLATFVSRDMLRLLELQRRPIGQRAPVAPRLR